MIEELTIYWELFRFSLLGGVLLACMLGQIGVLVVARDEIFLGAAIAQASTLGVAIAAASRTMLEPYLPGDWAASILAVSFSVIAAVAGTRLEARGRADGRSRESREAASGWMFLFAASLSILIVSSSDGGEEAIHELLLSGSVVVVSGSQVACFGVLALLGAVLLLWKHRTVLLLVSDGEMAAAVGVRTRLLSFALAAWLGLVIGLAIRASGLLFTFGVLVLPALAGKSLTREMRTLLVVAPLIGMPTVGASFLVAHFRDLPPGQLAVFVLAILVPLCWLSGLIRERRRAARARRAAR